jgi:transcriptional regulator with XRE-family HTH domain
MYVEVLDLKIFAKRLKEAREARKWSQLDLSFESHISQGAISEYEKGKRSPTGDKLKQLAKALYVTTDFLLGMDTDPDYIEPEKKQSDNPILADVLNDIDYWKSRGLFPPTQEEKDYIQSNYSFRLSFRNLEELKVAYYDMIKFVLQRIRERGEIKE